MNFHLVFTVTCFAFAVGDASAANPASRALQEADPKRVICRAPQTGRAQIFAQLKSTALKYGGKINVSVEKRGVVGTTFPDLASMEQATKSLRELGVPCSRDEIRTLTDTKGSLRSSRKLAEEIPWGITKTFQNEGIPLVNYYPENPDVKVCVIDTGYLNGHEDLPDNEVSANGGNINDSGGQCQYHGSHVAGTIAAVGDNGKGVIGVFQGDEIRVARVFEPIYFGLLCGFVYSSGLVGAVQDCLDSGAKITNMSLGGGGPSSAEESAFLEFYEDENMINIAASGNDGPGNISYPASYPGVMSVGATDINDNIAYFSGTNEFVDISAPGVDIRSTIGPGNNYDSYDGTSMACPHVVGAALTLWNAYPACSNAQIKNALEAGADDLGSSGRDDEFGNGRLNYWNSVDILEEFGCQGGPTMSPTEPFSCSMMDQSVVSINIETDNYGSETAWTFDDTCTGVELFSGGNYDGGEEYQTDGCVDEGGSYTFTITDTFGDGICCSYGSGSYTVSVGEETKTGGQFGSSETQTFGPEDSNGVYEGKGCNWVAQNPSARCGMCSEDGSICAIDYCLQTCGGCAPE